LRTLILWLGVAGLSARAAAGQPPCTVGRPTATLSVPHEGAPATLATEPSAPMWRTAASTEITKDCSKAMDYPRLKTVVRGFWTDTDLYLLFICPYSELNLFLPADNQHARSHLWDRDVVEIFLGRDWQNINHYREFEIAPTGDWIDLNIDLDHDLHDENWRSGWTVAARIDPTTHVWYAAARIPLASIDSASAHAGTRWRMNLYRTDGLGADPQRHFMCWQPTCVVDRDPNHVPENFGTLVFAR
jgi:Carbohydrate family 9 binding domain-like